MNFIFTKGRTKKRLFNGNWVNSSSNLAILSKHFIESKHVYDLPTDEEDPDRKVLHGSIKVSKEVTLDIYNTHLTHLAHSALRQMQFETLTEIINSNQNTNLKILMGDFNSTISSTDVMSFMQNTFTLDCYEIGNGEEPRYSLVDEYLAGRKVCVDHIFAIYPTGKTHVACMDSAIVLNSFQEDFNFYPSDHFGISTTLSIATK